MNKKEEEVLVILLAGVLFLSFVLFLHPSIHGFVVYSPSFDYNSSLINGSEGYRLIPNIEILHYNRTINSNYAEDVFIKEDKSDKTFSLDNGMRVRDKENKKVRFLIKFSGYDIPLNIDSAKLFLWAGKENKNAVLSLYNIDSSWEEGNCDCKLPKNNKDGPTWNNISSTIESSLSWNNAGGDCSDLIDSVTIHNENVIEFDVTDYLNSENGWIVIGDSINGAKNLRSKDASNENKKPYLFIEYSVYNYSYNSAEILTEDFSVGNLSSWNNLSVNSSGDILEYYSVNSGLNWSELNSYNLSEINSSSIMFKFVLDSSDDILYSVNLDYSLIVQNESSNYTEPSNETNSTEPSNETNSTEQNNTEQSNYTQTEETSSVETGQGISEGVKNFAGVTINSKTPESVTNEKPIEKQETKKLNLYEQFNEPETEKIVKPEIKQMIPEKSSFWSNINSKTIIAFVGLLFGIISSGLIYRKRLINQKN